MKKVKYGIRVKKTGELLQASRRTNAGADFCCDVTVKLDESGEEDWLVDKPEIAEYARLFSTPWYNASYDTPNHNHDLEPEETEVVKVTIQVEHEPINVSLPTFEEYMKIKYREINPAHYKYIMAFQKQERKIGRTMSYSVYDLRELIREGLWNPQKE